MRARTRAASVIAGAAALLCGMAAPALASTAAPALTPTGDYARYTACPVDAPAMLAIEFTQGAECLWSQTTGGQVTIGHVTVPIVNPVLIQGGTWFDRAGNQVWVNAQPKSQTLVDPGQPLPGTSVFRVVTELAGRIQINNSNFIFQEGTAVQLPVKFHLIDPTLSCYIGSDSDPVVLNLTTGTTSPPPPNTPISGTAGSLSILDGGSQVILAGDSLVDNAFSVPTAHGCGPGGDLDHFVNKDLGLPSPAGNNTAVLNGTTALASASPVLGSVPDTTSISCPANPAVPAGGSTTCTATDTVGDPAQGTPTGTVSFASSGPGSFGGGGTCTLSPVSTGIASCQVTYTPSVGPPEPVRTDSITATYGGDFRNGGSSGSTTVQVLSSL